MYKNRKLRNALVILLCLAVCCSALLFSTISASAEFSGGSGTKKDPYLIKTADDLYNMRNNLSACYKLAATIDMTGYKTSSKFFNGGFVPIGDDETKPFTGTFTCDLGSDGLPLYAILNLNIYNAKGDIYNHDWYGESDYPDALGQDAPYFYQTGLFGNTQGAYIQNIYLLNSTIYSSVVGQHNGRYADPTKEASLISYKAFIDHQGTAALIGWAHDTTVVHCAMTGSVTGKSQSHGGLIGRMTGGSVTKSYANATVETGGCWGIGVFIGCMETGSSATECMASGSIDAPLDGYGKMQQHSQSPGNGAGGFVGSVSGTVKDCYSTSNLSSRTRGSNFYGYYANSSGKTTNCYCSGTYEGKSSAPASSGNTNNCYISNAANGLQKEYNAASPADISAYFTTQKAWTAGTDGLPVLKNVNIVTDASIYVAGQERNTTAVAATDESANTASGEAETEEDSDDAEAGTKTVVKSGDTSSEKTSIVQIVLIAVLSVMIVGIAALTVVMVLNTLRYKPLHADGEEEEYDEDEEEAEDDE